MPPRSTSPDFHVANPEHVQDRDANRPVAVLTVQCRRCGRKGGVFKMPGTPFLTVDQAIESLRANGWIIIDYSDFRACTECAANDPVTVNLLRSLHVI